MLIRAAPSMKDFDPEESDEASTDVCPNIHDSQKYSQLRAAAPATSGRQDVVDASQLLPPSLFFTLSFAHRQPIYLYARPAQFLAISTIQTFYNIQYQCRSIPNSSSQALKPKTSSTIQMEGSIQSDWDPYSAVDII